MMDLDDPTVNVRHHRNGIRQLDDSPERVWRAGEPSRPTRIGAITPPDERPYSHHSKNLWGEAYRGWRAEGDTRGRPHHHFRAKGDPMHYSTALKPNLTTDSDDVLKKVENVELGIGVPQSTSTGSKIKSSVSFQAPINKYDPMHYPTKSSGHTITSSIPTSTSQPTSTDKSDDFIAKGRINQFDPMHYNPNAQSATTTTTGHPSAPTQHRINKYDPAHYHAPKSSSHLPAGVSAYEKASTSLSALSQQNGIAKPKVVSLPSRSHDNGLGGLTGSQQEKIQEIMKSLGIHRHKLAAGLGESNEPNLAPPMHRNTGKSN